MNAPSTPALRIRGLTKTYPNGLVALKSLDLEVPPGDFFALLGPNGAGKSTTIGIVTSLVVKSGGTVEVFGHDLDRDAEAVKRCIGMVPQEFNFSQFETPLAIVSNQAGYYGLPRRVARRRARECLTQLGLWHKRHEQARALSGGMKRRLMIARALVHEPQLLILDEPTAGVDIEVRRSMWTFLREINASGVTIILTTHYLEEAESLCRRIAIIDRGEIVADTTMKALLATLHVETFVLDLRRPVTELPALDGHRLRLVDPLTVEVEVAREASINALFEALSAAGIEVTSMRNKVNRLEELFVRLLDRGEAA